MAPREFHALSIELAKRNNAASLRSAISRAYYSAFHAGAATIRTLGFQLSKGAAAHGEVARCLVNANYAQIVSAAKELSLLHHQRIRADHSLDKVDVEQVANAIRSVQSAGRIIDAFDEVLAGPRRTQVQAAIAGWRKSNGYP